MQRDALKSKLALGRRALVIGGSVGGLFAAHLQRAMGWDVAVYERAAEDLAGRGAGIGTRPELFAVLRRHFSGREVVELTVLVGTYLMHNRVFSALRVDLEP